MFWNFLSLFYKEIHDSQRHGAHKDYSLRNCKWQDDKGSLWNRGMKFLSKGDRHVSYSMLKYPHLMKNPPLDSHVKAAPFTK